jgi:hypothetical protein
MHSYEYSDHASSEEFVTVDAEPVHEGILESMYRKIQYYRRFITNYVYCMHEESCNRHRVNVEPEHVNVFNFLYTNGK